jgi:phosphonate transport system permease protein
MRIPSAVSSAAEPQEPPPPRIPAQVFKAARRRRLGNVVVVGVLLVLGVLATLSLDIRLERLSGLANLLELVREAFPPDAALASIAAKAVFETVQIAFLGTLIGGAGALPLAILASRNLFGRGVTIPARLILAAIRTLPALLWAVLFVVAVGLGPLAGVLASGVYTVGYLGKLHYEAIEGIDPGPLNAIRSAGASRGQLVRHVVLPDSANHLLSQLLFAFEYNVRASSIVGFVGAGGIGFYIAGYLTVLRYQSVFTLLLAVFVTILAIDYLSVRIRDRWLVPARAERNRESEIPATI